MRIINNDLPWHRFQGKLIMEVPLETNEKCTQITASKQCKRVELDNLA